MTDIIEKIAEKLSKNAIFIGFQFCICFCFDDLIE